MATAKKTVLKYTGKAKRITLPGGVDKATASLTQADLEGMMARKSPFVKYVKVSATEDGTENNN